MPRYLRATLAALVALTLAAATVSATWPTTGVEANDAFERNAGRLENVGIYQRVYGSATKAWAKDGSLLPA